MSDDLTPGAEAEIRHLRFEAEAERQRLREVAESEITRLRAESRQAQSDENHRNYPATDAGDDALLVEIHRLEDEVTRLKFMSRRPRHGFLKLVIKDFETNPRAQYRVHLWGMRYWLVNFVLVT